MVVIEHLGHSAFRLKGSQIVYIDPYKLTAPQPPADIVLITHSHSDHCSPTDLAVVCTSRTVVFAPPDCSDTFKQINLPLEHRPVEPGRKYEYAGVKIRTIPAYNTNKKFHPRAKNWVGYFVEMDGESFYHCGDSDVIPEMKDLRPDYALLPVSGIYVMTAEEAAEACAMIHPLKGAIPMHFGVVAGTKADAERFLKLISKEKPQK
ncbi:MAG: MBL fold metallo-hydrolase [Candidatus Brocadiia bacterium]